jgi:hypothetical protein
MLQTSEPLEKRLATGVVPPIFSRDWTTLEPFQAGKGSSRVTLLKECSHDKSIQFDQ